MSELKKAGFAALIGRPNVGKSTLMNTIIGQKIAITSNKPQTTRNQIRTILTDDRGQVVFVDTPGIHQAKNKLGEYMVTAAQRTLSDVDVVLFLVEPDTKIGAGDTHILEELKKVDVPVILVINKTDTIAYEQLLPVIKTYSEAFAFNEIIPVSALKKKGIEELEENIFKYLPEGMPFYDEETVTDQPIRAIAAEMIREKALQCLKDEVPHGIAVGIDTMKKRGKLYDIEATIVCERNSHKGIIIGKQGAMLKKIGSAARYEIEDLVGCQVNLKLWVKVQKEWRDSDFLIKNFGYDKKEL